MAYPLFSRYCEKIRKNIHEMSYKGLAKQSRQAYTDLQSKNPMGFFYFPMENRKDVVFFHGRGVTDPAVEGSGV